MPAVTIACELDAASTRRITLNRLPRLPSSECESNANCDSKMLCKAAMYVARSAPLTFETQVAQERPEPTATLILSSHVIGAASLVLDCVFARLRVANCIEE